MSKTICKLLLVRCALQLLSQFFAILKFYLFALFCSKNVFHLCFRRQLQVQRVISHEYTCFDSQSGEQATTCIFVVGTRGLIVATSILVLGNQRVKSWHMEVVEWSARLARKRAFRVRRLLAPLSMMHVLL